MSSPASLILRALDVSDSVPIAAAFAALGWNKPESQYERYLAEQTEGARDVIVATLDSAFAGYLTIVRESGYPPFRAENIPEIADFNVLPHVRRCGIGSALMDLAEARVFARSPIVGIGVGLTADYGAAQRLYAKRGYLPDGRGLTQGTRPLAHGETALVDDSLVLYFTKSART